MPERLNNTNENINHNSAEDYRVPPFNPTAARAAQREAMNRMQLEQAPGTIIDPDKARVMAEAGNPDRTDAAKYAKLAKEAPDDIFDYRTQARWAREFADEAEAEAEKEYDANQNS